MNMKALYNFFAQIVASGAKLSCDIIPFAFFFTIKIIFNNSKLKLFYPLLQSNNRVTEETENQKYNQKNRNKYTDINKQTKFFRQFKNVTRINRTHTDFTNAIT